MTGVAVATLQVNELQLILEIVEVAPHCSRHLFRLPICKANQMLAAVVVVVLDAPTTRIVRLKSSFIPIVRIAVVEIIVQVLGSLALRLLAINRAVSANPRWICFFRQCEFHPESCSSLGHVASVLGSEIVLKPSEAPVNGFW